VIFTVENIRRVLRCRFGGTRQNTYGCIIRVNHDDSHDKVTRHRLVAERVDNCRKVVAKLLDYYGYSQLTGLVAGIVVRNTGIDDTEDLHVVCASQ